MCFNVTDESIEFGIVGVIPYVLSITNFFSKRHKAIVSGNHPPLSRLESALCLRILDLEMFCLQTSQDYGGPFWRSWPASYLELLLGVWHIYIFRIEGEAKRFPKEASPCLQSRLPYSPWCVVKISTLMGSHGPLRSNFIRDISPQFLWSWLCSVTVYLCIIPINHVWNHHPR